MTHRIEDRDHVDAVAIQLARVSELSLRLSRAVREATAELLAPAVTGRWELSQLTSEELAAVPARVAIYTWKHLRHSADESLCATLAERRVGVVFSTKDRELRVPPRLVGRTCVVMATNPRLSVLSAGVAHAAVEPGRDRLSRDEYLDIRWLVREDRLRRVTLSELTAAERRKLLVEMVDRSGQQRIDELFRIAINRIVDRQTVEAVARQKDAAKRVRDARKRLRSEGIGLLGDPQRDRERAKELGLPVPAKSEWISYRLRPL